MEITRKRAGYSKVERDAVIYYEIYGSGRALAAFTRPGNQAIGAFIEQIGEFSKQYQVIAVDTY